MSKINNRKTFIRTLLDNSDNEDIKLFVARYANKDTKFKLYLKIHFLNTLKQEEIEPFLDSILNQLIKPKTDSIEKVSRSNYNLFCKLLEELLAQTEDKLALEKYVDCFYLCRAVLNKIVYTIGVYEQYDQKITSFSNRFHKIFSTLLQKDIAPELRHNIKSNLLYLYSKSYYPMHTEYNIIDIMDSIDLEDPTYIKLIKQECLLKINREDLEQNSSGLLSNYLRIVFLQNKSTNTKVIQYFSSEIISSCFQFLFQQCHFDLILYHLSFFRQRYDNSAFYDDLSIKTYESTQNTHNLKEELELAFWKYKDYKYFDKLKSIHSIPQWKKYQNSFKSKLKNENDIEFYAQFLKKENMLDELAKLLRKEVNYELIKDFSFYLFEKDKHKLELVYQYYIAHIYNINPTSVRRPINMLLKFIEDNNDKRMLKNITNFVIKNTNYQIS